MHDVNVCLVHGLQRAQAWVHAQRVRFVNARHCDAVARLGHVRHRIIAQQRHVVRRLSLRYGVRVLLHTTDLSLSCTLHRWNRLEDLVMSCLSMSACGARHPCNEPGCGPAS